MTAAQASRAKVIAAYAAIYIIWGSTYLAIKYAIATIPPFALGAARFTIAGVLLYAWARLRRRDIKTTPVQWLHAFIIGALMLGVGNGAVVWAELRIPSGIAALIVAVVPLWVVLLDWWRPGGRKPHGRTILGVLVGLAGLGLLIGPGASSGGDVDILASIVLLIGSLAWSIATVYGKRAAVPGYPPLTSSMQLLGGGVSLVIVSLVAGEASRFNPAAFELRSVLSLFYLVVFGSIIAFSAYSWLMRVSDPARIATYAYVNPVVAMFLGWLFAGEKLGARTLIAAAIVLGGVALIVSGINKGDG